MKRTRQAVMGLDLGGTKLAAAIFTPKGELLHRDVVPLEKRSGVEVGKLIQGQVVKLLAIAKQNRLKIEAIGVCVPGIANQKTAKVWAPNISGWEDYPLHDEIRSALGKQKIQIAIDSDRAACILGESWLGAAQGCRDAIFIAVGTGIGAGILIDGKVLRGSNDSAGAIGWLALDKQFRDDYTACGCFEGHASGDGIAKVVRQLLGKNKSYKGPLRKKKEITAHDVFENFLPGDPIAGQAVNEAIHLWGMAVANLISLFNPEKIIFGGGIFGPAARYLPEIFAEAWRWAQPISIRQVKLELSKLGSDAALYGAGYLAWERLKSTKSLPVRGKK